MIENVGIRIKKLRKELNMTQSELAGDEMTKSMLSQIENNVSSPSMKSLEYLAARLNKPVAYFVEEDELPSTQRYTTIGDIKDIEEQLQGISKIIENRNLDEAEKQLKQIKELLDPNNINKSYTDVVFKLGSYLIKEKQYEYGEEYLRQAIETYYNNGMYIEAAKGYVELGRRLYEEFKIDACLKLCDRAIEVCGKAINRDVSFEIELYHYRILMLTMTDDADTLIENTKKALVLSETSGKYYKADELYRLNAAFNYLKGDYEEYDYNINKALQFADFTENKQCLSQIYLLLAFGALDKGEPYKALEYIEKHREYNWDPSYLYYIQKAMAYFFIGDYRTAYENITLVNYPEQILIKLDYLLFWSSKLYEGLILNKLGRYEDAIGAMKLGIEKMSKFEVSVHLAKAYQNLSDVYSEHNDFENAFLTLKKSNELNEIIKKNKNIFY